MQRARLLQAGGVGAVTIWQRVRAAGLALIRTVISRHEAGRRAIARESAGKGAGMEPPVFMRLQSAEGARGLAGEGCLGAVGRRQTQARLVRSVARLHTAALAAAAAEVMASCRPAERRPSRRGRRLALDATDLRMERRVSVAFTHGFVVLLGEVQGLNMRAGKKKTRLINSEKWLLIWYHWPNVSIEP